METTTVRARTTRLDLLSGTSSLTILGSTGSGKTRLAKELAQRAASLGDSVVVLDPEDEHRDCGFVRVVGLHDPTEYSLALSYACDRLCAQAAHPFLLVEEAGRLAPDGLADLLRDVRRRIADAGGTLVLVAQPAAAFAGHAPTILDPQGATLLLWQTHRDLSVLAPLLHLSRDERRLLAIRHVGTGLLLADGDRTPGVIIASGYLLTH